MILEGYTSGYQAAARRKADFNVKTAFQPDAWIGDGNQCACTLMMKSINESELILHLLKKEKKEKSESSFSNLRLNAANVITFISSSYSLQLC